MNDKQIVEAIHGCFEEMVVAIDGRLDQMQAELWDGLHGELRKQEARFDQIDKRLDRVEERLDRMEERFDRMDERLDQMDERLDQMDVRLDGLEKHLKEHDDQLDIINQKLTGLALHVENETDRNIQLLAENHLMLVGKLNEGIEAANGNKLYAIKVNYLVGRVDKLYDEVEDIKKQMKIRRTGKRSLKALS